MKVYLLLSLVSAAMLIGCGGGAPVTQTPTRTEEDPFPVLQAYGNWIDVAPYGKVWQPGVSSGWRPYVSGQWIWTDRGWMWDSDEPYGWVVYHYGYWTTFGAAGWVWVPDYEWTPARVRWYNNGEYIGWAPMPPPNALFPAAYETGSENFWVVVHAYEFTRPDIGRFRAHGPIPPPTGRAGIDRAPDVRDIEAAGNSRVPFRKTYRTDVRNGKRVLTRVTPRAPEPPPQAPAPQPLPPPTGTPQPLPPPMVTPKPAPPSLPPAQKQMVPPGKPADKRTTRTPAPRKTEVPTPVIVKPTPAKEEAQDTVQTKKAPVQPPKRPHTQERAK